MITVWSRHPLNEGKEPKWYEFKDLEDLANTICNACSLTSLGIDEHFAAVQYIEQVPELLTEGDFISYYENEDFKDYGAPSVKWVRKDSEDGKILQSFNSGEWCLTQDICRILGITFAEGLSKYDFDRQARWAPAPAEGQIITTKFRIKKEDK
jgi:hypothetical protein